MSVKEMDPSGGVTGNEEAFEIAMASLGFTTTDQLDSAIGKLNSKISKLKESVKSLKASIAASPGVDSVDSETAKGAFDLLEVPDEQLTEGQIAAKKKQNMLFRLHQGRQRAKELREKKKEIDTQETKRLEEKRKTDFKGWLNEMRKKRQDLLTSKAKRHRRRTEMAKRHTLASQQRMKIITELARGGSGSARKMKDDSFGARDEDWDVYKQINLEGGDSESEEEGERLDQVEQTLREHDPGFGEVGVSGTGFSTTENHQLHIGLERIRIPEILFQPSLIGHDQMGLAECVEATLKGFTDDQQRRLAENIFLTGGLSKYPGLVERLDAEVATNTH
jgi:actin-related protein 5